jgi:hypothetical protein
VYKSLVLHWWFFLLFFLFSLSHTWFSHLNSKFLKQSFIYFSFRFSSCSFDYCLFYLKYFLILPSFIFFTYQIWFLFFWLLFVLFWILFLIEFIFQSIHWYLIHFIFISNLALTILIATCFTLANFLDLNIFLFYLSTLNWLWIEFFSWTGV